MIERLLFAFVSGALIGIDRGVKRRGAGIKTHILVCCSATLVMLTGQCIDKVYGGTGDVARLGAQVISGVGFLGVGTIMVDGRNHIKGAEVATMATLTLKHWRDHDVTMQMIQGAAGVLFVEKQ